MVGGLIALTCVKSDLNKCNATQMKLDMLQSHKAQLLHTKIKTAPHSIPSGKQLSQVYKEWITQQYKENEVCYVGIYVSVNNFLTVMLVPLFHRLQSLTMYL